MEEEVPEEGAMEMEKESQKVVGRVSIVPRDDDPLD